MKYAYHGRTSVFINMTVVFEKALGNFVARSRMTEGWWWTYDVHTVVGGIRIHDSNLADEDFERSISTILPKYG
jgi:hypothetical protein